MVGSAPAFGQRLYAGEVAKAGKPNIVLTGFMGTGKTTVGRLLAVELGLELVDTDAIIEARHGPIALIFDERGEAAFRQIERDVAAELAGRDGLVISTGGRMMLDPANRVSLGGNGDIYCLAATADEIFERVTADGSAATRPLLAGPDPRQRIVDLLAERAAEYARFTQVTTGGRPPKAIAADIIKSRTPRPNIGGGILGTVRSMIRRINKGDS
ncbi:MAG: shikimate kinase [Candidatus Poriferisodalaceae bacterium]